MLKDYEKLGTKGQKVFDITHKEHLRAMGTETQKDYTLENVKKIKINNRERCLEVYYRNGEWFKYFANGTWG